MLEGHEFKDRIQAILGVPLDDDWNVELYTLAFTHKSADTTKHMLTSDRSCSFPAKPIKSYDRLEFIGDAVINLVVALYLFYKYPNQPEGFMTRLRTKLVSGKCLCHIAKCLHLHQLIRMNMKAINNGWNCNDRILEDVFEALVAAISLDQGLDLAQKFVLNCIIKYVPMDSIESEDNFKDILMRYTQAEGIDLPLYHAHESFEFGRRQYEVTVYCQQPPPADSPRKNCKGTGTKPAQPIGFGVAFTKKKAEQESAAHAIQKLKLALQAAP